MQASDDLPGQGLRLLQALIVPYSQDARGRGAGRQACQFGMGFSFGAKRRSIDSGFFQTHIR